MIFDKWKNTNNEDINGELWRPVPGYNQTEASNYGRIRVIDRWVKTGRGNRKFRTAKVRSQVLGKDGYLRVDAALNGECKKVTAHRMCALAFKPNPFNKNTVQHFNDIKHCNEEWNLGWFTQSEQVKDTWSKKRRRYNSKENCIRGESHYNCKLKNEDIVDIFTSNRPGVELALKYSISNSTVHEIRHSKTRIDVTKNIILAK